MEYTALDQLFLESTDRETESPRTENRTTVLECMCVHACVRACMFVCARETLSETHGERNNFIPQLKSIRKQ